MLLFLGISSAIAQSSSIPPVPSTVPIPGGSGCNNFDVCNNLYLQSWTETPSSYCNVPIVANNATARTECQCLAQIELAKCFNNDPCVQTVPALAAQAGTANANREAFCRSANINPASPVYPAWLPRFSPTPTATVGPTGAARPTQTGKNDAEMVGLTIFGLALAALF